jgi:hypothetical protein
MKVIRRPLSEVFEGEKSTREAEGGRKPASRQLF